MIRNGGGLIDVTLCDGFLYCASVFSKSIAKTTSTIMSVDQTLLFHCILFISLIVSGRYSENPAI